MARRRRRDREAAEREVRVGGEMQNYPGPRPPDWRGEEGAGGPQRPSAPEKLLEEQQREPESPPADREDGAKDR